MLLFTSKLTRQIHSDVIALYREAPLYPRSNNTQDSSYFGNDVMYVCNPEAELGIEWDEESGDDKIAPHFQHYPTGVKVWLGATAGRTHHSKISEEGWRQVIEECRRVVQYYQREAAA